MTLREALPNEFFSEFMNTRTAKYLDVEVVKEKEFNWPGNHKNVYCWWVLENGYAVGWNENPARGWSFPVVRYNK